MAKIEDVVMIGSSPTSAAYVNFLLPTCALDTSISCSVAILPCFSGHV